MNGWILFSVVLIACALLFFVAPHHRKPKYASFKPRTMGGIYRDFFKEMPATFHPRMRFMVILALAGLFASFYPAMLVLLIRFLPAGPDVVFIFGGMICGVGAIANFLAMLISDMTIGFGGGSSSKTETKFILIIPVFELIFAVASIVVGVSNSCNGWAHRVVS